MLNTIKAVVKSGKIELSEPIELQEGAELLVTVLSEETEFWIKASQPALDAVWGNEADDIYAQLLKK